MSHENTLIKLAHALDKAGHYAEADAIDHVLKRVAFNWPWKKQNEVPVKPEEDYSVHLGGEDFEPGGQYYQEQVYEPTPTSETPEQELARLRSENAALRGQQNRVQPSNGDWSNEEFSDMLSMGGMSGF